MQMNNKYGLIFEDSYVESEANNFDFNEDITRRIICDSAHNSFNFIYEGDNINSLKWLSKNYNNKIDVIYIDPPYNTGSSNWKYNNNYFDNNLIFKHSNWLSMMKHRLVIAKYLLKDDGVFICAIDENELCYLYLLIEDIFGNDFKIDIITIVHNPRGIQGSNFSYVNEYAIFVYRKGYKVIGFENLESNEVEWRKFRNCGSESNRLDAKNCFYPILIKDNVIIGFGDVCDPDYHPNKNEYNLDNGIVSVYPIDNSGVERKWRYARKSVEQVADFLKVTKDSNGFDIEIGKNYKSYKTVWINKKFDANIYGTQLLSRMILVFQNHCTLYMNVYMPSYKIEIMQLFLIFLLVPVQLVMQHY